jgi:hypothetical protein
MAKGQIKQKMTEETLRKLDEVFAIDGSIEEACYYANISPDTYYRWVKEKPELSERFKRLRERPVLKARQTVVKSLDQPEYAFKYLERKKKNEFAQRTELSGSNGSPIELSGIDISIRK